MDILKESNKMGLYPTLEFQDKSPLKKGIHSSPIRIIQDAPKVKETVELLNKPPGRRSPFKGKKASLTTAEIFSVTPKRININSKTQSVDRTAFTFNMPINNDNNDNDSLKPEITFNSLKNMAPSNLRGISQTPLRMISSKKNRVLPNSEQIDSRFNRPTIASSLKSVGELSDGRANLLDQFKSKSILKRKLSPNFENESESSSDDSTDMTTTLNTLKNTGSAKDVMKFLKVEPEDQCQPRKKRAVTFAKDNIDSTPITNEKIMETLQIVLQNQSLILKKLEKLEGKHI